MVHSTEVQQAVNLEPKCKVLCHNEIICRRHLCSNLQHVLTLSKGITAEWVLLVTHQYYFFQKFHIFFMVYGKSNQIISYFEGWQGGTDPLPLETGVGVWSPHGKKKLSPLWELKKTDCTPPKISKLSLPSICIFYLNFFLFKVPKWPQKAWLRSL